MTDIVPAEHGVRPALVAGATVGLIGTGAMGAALCGLLIRSGFRVVAFDPAAGALANAVAQGATGAHSAQHLIGRVQVVIICVSSVAALDATIEAALASVGLPGVVIEMSTLPVVAKQSARERLAAAGATMLDCPMSGTSAQAAAGDLVVFASGEQEALEHCRPVLCAVARRTVHAGAFGAGMRLKLLANHLVGLHSLVAAEVLMLAEAAGLDMACALDALSDSAGASRMLQLRGELMVRRDFQPPTASIDIIVKDGGMILEMARAANCRLPLFGRAHALFCDAQRDGLGKDDIAAVFEHLAKHFRGDVDPPA